MSSVTVVEDGNRRKGGMNEEEMRQCAMDIQLWFERNGARPPKGAASSDFQRLEKALDLPLPEALKVLLTEVNGGIWFMEKQAMSVEMIIETVNEHESSKLWKRGTIPFCGDAGGMLVIDTKTEAIFEWDADDGLGDEVDRTMADHLESYRDVLMNCEYMDDIGVVEKVGSKSSGNSRK